MTAPAGAAGAEGNEPEVQETDGDGSKPELTLEDALKELAKVRKEAADKRVKNRELEAAAKELAELKQAQMSDLEKAQARVKELEAANSKTALDAAIAVAVAKYKFDEEDVEFIHGNTPEEVAASAEKLAKRLGSKKDEEGQEPPRNNPNLFPGATNRGKPVGAGREDNNAALRAKIWG